MSQVRITQSRSTIGQSQRHRATLETLGLRGINTTTVRESSDSLEGQLRLVAHLVTIERDGAKE